MNNKRMVKEVKQSLVVRSGMALAAVLLLAVLNLLMSYLTAENSENDAVRINISGSLRMQSYRIANRLVMKKAGLSDDNSETLLSKEVDEFESRLFQPVLYNYIQSKNHDELLLSFNEVEALWRELKPQIFFTDVDLKKTINNIDELVLSIDILTKKLELQTESKFRLLRLIQGISLLISICIVFLAMYQIYFKVVNPLWKLVDMAVKIRRGDFSMQLASKGQDELSLLTDTLNEMVASLNDMYLNLEDKVAKKTLRLERAQQRLQLLYEASRRLNSGDDFVEQLRKTVGSLREYLNIYRVDLYMMQESSEHPFLISSTENKPVSLEKYDESLLESEKHRKFMLARGDEQYGFLVLSDNILLKLNNEQEELLTALLDTIASAIANEVRHDQQHRLALMEERTVIARELHDSLAQSLSYTKIQVSRFQMLQKQSAGANELEDVLEEIRTGIQSAYGQLREILATFRLQLDSPGLQSSLEMTVDEFQQKGDLPITLTYDLGNFPLSPNEEVHVLQVVREALSNVIRHSGASRAEVLLKLDASGNVQVSIVDNGCGFSREAVGPNHYGKTIMSERSSILGGKIAFSDRDEGGAQVLLSFWSKRVGEQQL